jgi:hypothetical protein
VLFNRIEEETYLKFQEKVRPHTPITHMHAFCTRSCASACAASCLTELAVQFGEKKDASVEFPLRLVTGKVLEAKVSGRVRTWQRVR